MKCYYAYACCRLVAYSSAQICGKNFIYYLLCFVGYDASGLRLDDIDFHDLLDLTFGPAKSSAVPARPLSGIQMQAASIDQTQYAPAVADTSTAIDRPQRLPLALPVVLARSSSKRVLSSARQIQTTSPRRVVAAQSPHSRAAVRAAAKDDSLTALPGSTKLIHAAQLFTMTLTSAHNASFHTCGEMLTMAAIANEHMAKMTVRFDQSMRIVNICISL